MTTGSTSSDPKPNLGKTIINDFRRGDIEQTLRRDFSELKEFMLTEERQKRLRDMKRIKRWLFMSTWFLESLFLKLTPARRILLLLGMFLLISSINVQNQEHSTSFEGFHLLGGLVLLLIIMLELKDKLVAHEELEAGHAVQNALMPDRTPQMPGWSLWLYTRSANEVGGDLVDFIQLTPQRTGVTLGDIAGKGLRAALLTAKLQATIRALAPDILSLSELGSKLNFIFCRDSLPNLFASVVYCELQPDSGAIRLVNAGHLPPLILRGSRIEKTDKGGMALGLSPQATFSEQHLDLAKGEMMLVYSDGLTEARNLDGAFFGEQRVLDLLPTLSPYSAQQIGDRLLAEVDLFIGEARAFDDISIAILKRS
jgi:phosphoserine phosphatase RsbU/P